MPHGAVLAIIAFWVESAGGVHRVEDVVFVDGAPESPPQEREVVEDVPLKRSVYVVFPKFRELTFSEMTVNAEEA